MSAGSKGDELGEWVLAQRWFGSKARAVSEVNVLRPALRADEPPLTAAFLEPFAAGTHELYQLLVARAPATDWWQGSSRRCTR
jgi:hypothetical protein